MSELILELYTEEIPAFMQKKAEEAYYNIFTKAFELEEIMYQHLEMHVAARRVVLHATGLPPKTIAKHIELKGPKVGAPEVAIEGFCKTNNISKNDLVIKSIKDQECYVYESVKPEIELTKILPSVLEKAISEYIWPKSMNWGSYEMRWVRPMLNIMCIFDAQILDFSYFHLKANNQSFGHRFTNHDAFTISSWDEYIAGLAKHHVILDREERLKIITHEISIIESEKNLLVDVDPKLLEEVAGLVEYPSILIGRIPEKFMHVPNEILSLAMRTHQRYFTTRTKDGEFAPYFVFASNLPNAGVGVAEGNEKVLSARLADAAYFYTQDQKIPLKNRLDKLKEVVFHAKLGSIYDKSERLVKLCEYLKPNDLALAKAALLCKCDLVTEAVVEFPELQGIMGSYYAKLEGVSDEVTFAIRNHYLPLGNNDDVPSKYAAYLALADKMDSLVGLMFAGERATGSKDPYALRRYALGIIKIILKNHIEGISTRRFVEYSFGLYGPQNEALTQEILSFIEDRLRHYLKEEYDPNVIAAAIDFSLDDDLCMIEKKISALHNFTRSMKGDLLLQLYRRVNNILGAEHIDAKIDVSKFKTLEEKNLYNTINDISPKVADAVVRKNFEDVFNLLGILEGSIGQFFDNVLVNDDDHFIAQNRKALLVSISRLFSQIARFENL